MEECNSLLIMSNTFSCPNKLGEANSISSAEQLQTNLQVGKLYRELKRHSPFLKGDKRILAFGPIDAWDVTKTEEGGENYKLVTPDREIELHFKRDAFNGLMWLLVFMLHPASPMVRKAGQQEDVCWPIAQKIGREKAIQKEIKLDPNADSKWDSMKSDEQFETESQKSA
jgi:hypothetical protein